MSKVVRLSTSQFREWRQNTPQLIRPDGSVARAVEPFEEKNIAPIVARAKQSGQSIQAEVLDKPLIVEVVKTGQQADNFYVRTFYDFEQFEVDGKTQVVPLEKVTGRDVIKAYFIKLHGTDCQLRAPNGNILGVARDPNVERPSFQDSQRLAPKPENCECKPWGDPHPDKHHPVCKWNSLAPHAERGTPGEVASQMTKVPLHPAGVSMQVPGIANAPAAILARVAPTVQNLPGTPKPIPEPDNCECSPWMRPDGSLGDGKHHHPICPHYEAWEAQTRVPMSLVDLDKGKIIRPAQQSEVDEARMREAKTGDSLVVIDGASYGVLPTAEALEMLRTEPESTSGANAPTRSMVATPDSVDGDSVA